MTKIKLPLRSVSQINSFTRCPMAYKLARIDKVWARPAAWLPQGTAFHETAELIEIWEGYGMPLSEEEAIEIFRVLYKRDTDEKLEDTPNMEYWSASGPYHGAEDIERRFHVGIEQVEKFLAWRSTNKHELWITPDGEPAIEIGFEIELSGIIVRGYIDAVVVVDGELRVRDYKTGKSPGDDFQLGVYALAIAKKYGVEAPKTGDYYMAGKRGKKASLTHPFDLTEWTEEAITARFHEVEALIQHGVFEALPEPDKCAFCDVSYSCPVYRGEA